MFPVRHMLGWVYFWGRKDPLSTAGPLMDIFLIRRKITCFCRKIKLYVIRT